MSVTCPNAADHQPASAGLNQATEDWYTPHRASRVCSVRHAHGNPRVSHPRAHSARYPECANVLWSDLEPLIPRKVPSATSFLPSAAVLPEQFYSPITAPASMSGVLALMHAVLDDAPSCWQQQFTAKGHREQRLAYEAEQWFFSEDASWPFAFVNICAALSLDPNYIRRGLRRWGRAPLLRSPRSTGHAVSKPRRLTLVA